MLTPGEKWAEMDAVLHGDLGTILEWAENGRENTKTDIPMPEMSVSLAEPDASRRDVCCGGPSQCEVVGPGTLATRIGLSVHHRSRTAWSWGGSAGQSNIRAPAPLHERVTTSVAQAATRISTTITRRRIPTIAP